MKHKLNKRKLKTEVRTPRIKVLPDKTFTELWKNAQEFSDSGRFIASITHPLNETYVNFEKYNISSDAAYKLLKEIHKKANMPLKDIMAEQGLKNHEVCEIFCIPTRTLESWKSGVNKCPDYVRLMILRQYHMINFGPYITTESSLKFQESYPKKYISRKTMKSDILPSNNTPSQYKRRDIINSENGIYTSSDDILLKTDYLKKIIKEKRNGSNT